MKPDTPETDAEVFFAEVGVNRTESVVTAETARKLERERNAALEQVRLQSENILQYMEQLNEMQARALAAERDLEAEFERQAGESI